MSKKPRLKIHKGEGPRVAPLRYGAALPSSTELPFGRDGITFMCGPMPDSRWCDHCGKVGFASDRSERRHFLRCLDKAHEQVLRMDAARTARLARQGGS